MARALSVTVEAPWSLVIRGASVFEAMVHGPGAAAASIDYLPPSAVAGLLASIYYEAVTQARQQYRPRQPSSSGIFADQHECLSRLLGSEDYRIYTGFLELRRNGREDALLAYTPQGYVALDKLVDVLSYVGRILSDRGPGDAVKEAACMLNRHSIALPKTVHTGIALRRNARSVLEGMIYTMSEVWLQHRQHGLSPKRCGLKAYVRVEGGDGEGLLNAPLTLLVKLGAENKPAFLHVAAVGVGELDRILIHGSDGNDGGKDRWILYLTSPAILRKPLGRTVLGIDTAKRVAEDLVEHLKAYGVTPVKPYLLSLARKPIEVLMPGWSMVLRNLRYPVPIVPPGTALYVEMDAGRAPQVVRQGVGSYTRLGWGTVIAVRAGYRDSS